MANTQGISKVLARCLGLVCTSLVLFSFCIAHARDTGPIEQSVSNTPEKFSASYAPYVKGVEDRAGKQYLIMVDGAKILWDDGEEKDLETMLSRPDLQDQLSMPYPVGPLFEPPKVGSDPGRVRVERLFRSVYGADGKAVRKNLERIPWAPGKAGATVRFNSQNGASRALQKAGEDLASLPKKFRKYVRNLGGTFNWRKIAGTERLSAHSFGIAVDIGVRYSDYWRWGAKGQQPLTYRNRIPAPVVEVFEKHCFIWGGKWYHYDTMHFEYRPELFHEGSCANHR